MAALAGEGAALAGEGAALHLREERRGRERVGAVEVDGRGRGGEDD
jgi:hypothetical protein